MSGVLRCMRGMVHYCFIGLKKGVGVMAGKEFVCYFCVSTCMLALEREVAGVKEKLCSAKAELKELKEDNRRLKCEMEKKGERD